MKTSQTRLRRPPYARCAAALVTAVAALALPSLRPASAGCLAPADVQVDVSGTIGPFWGNDAGRLLYARGVGAGQELVGRNRGALAEPIASAGDRNPFVAGSFPEVWSAFHSGAMNERGDAGFTASTSTDDDPQTPQDESLPRRGGYVLRGNTFYEIGRHGGASPVPLPPETGSGFATWGSFFDVVPFGRDATSSLRVLFSAQLAAPDVRYGIFSWDEFAQAPAAVALTGEASPGVDGSPTGLPFTTFGRVRCNEAGDAVFYALTQAGPSTPIVPALFRIDRDGGWARIVTLGADGDAAPGGGTLALLQDFDVDGEGGVVFAASVDGGQAATALFRATAPNFQVERVLREGETTALGPAFGPFSQAQVRCSEDGAATIVVPLSDETLGSGFFVVAPGATEAQPLGAAAEPVTLAALGGGRAGYQTATQTRTILPSDGTSEGPGDFRVAYLDLRNAVPLRKDLLQADVRFRLAPWGTGVHDRPAVFAASAQRVSPTATLGPADLARIAEVRLQVSESPGQVFVFGIGGTDAAPKGTLTVNGTQATVSSLRVAKAKDAATWRFSHGVGKGSFTLDLTRGVAKLALAQGSVLPSFTASRFPIQLTLRTDADVAAQRTGAAAYFHRAVRLDADQPEYGTGRRVLSRGERVPGGGFFVDAFSVSRKLKVVAGRPEPQVSSDAIKMTGTIRLCPGSTPPSTPTITADATIGDFAITGLTLNRVGTKGSKYAGKGRSGDASVSLVVDAISGAFSFTASGIPPLSQCIDADFSPGAATNSAKAAVGGMSVPVSVTIARVYASQFDVAVTRRPGGKSFVR